MPPRLAAIYKLKVKVLLWQSNLSDQARSLYAPAYVIAQFPNGHTTVSLNWQDSITRRDHSLSDFEQFMADSSIPPEIQIKAK